MQPKHAILGVVGLVVIGALVTDNGSHDASEAQTGCRTDYLECSDLKQALDENDEILSASTTCQMRAEDRAKYGETEFPWTPFGSAKVDGSNLRQGRIVLVEHDAQFQNGFGAMQNVTVECHYDLISDRVTALDIRE
jgi:hypothetical protein